MDACDRDQSHCELVLQHCCSGRCGVCFRKVRGEHFWKVFTGTSNLTLQSRSLIHCNLILGPFSLPTFPVSRLALDERENMMGRRSSRTRHKFPRGIHTIHCLSQNIACWPFLSTNNRPHPPNSSFLRLRKAWAQFTIWRAADARWDFKTDPLIASNS